MLVRNLERRTHLEEPEYRFVGETQIHFYPPKVPIPTKSKVVMLPVTFSRILPPFTLQVNEISAIALTIVIVDFNNLTGTRPRIVAPA